MRILTAGISVLEKENSKIVLMIQIKHIILINQEDLYSVQL